jgi:hypothetical protein
MNEIINQLQNLDSISFQDAADKAALIGMAVFPVAASVVAFDYFRNPRSSEEGMRGAEAQLLVEALEVRDGRVKSRASKWGSTLLITAGISTLALNLMDPQLEYKADVEGVESATVIDASKTMQKTEDMMSNGNTEETESDELASNTRLGAVIDIANTLNDVYPSDMKSGIFAFGENVEQVVPLVTNRETITIESFDDIDDNGGSLAEAIRNAGNALSKDEVAGGRQVIIYTDGTVDNPEAAIAEIEELDSEGIKVLLALTGTDDGSYFNSEFDLEPYPSGVQSSPLSIVDDLENVSVVESNDPAEIKKAVEDILNQTTKTTEKRPTNIFWYAGLGLIGAGVINQAIRTWKRK